MLTPNKSPAASAAPSDAVRRARANATTAHVSAALASKGSSGCTAKTYRLPLSAHKTSASGASRVQPNSMHSARTASSTAHEQAMPSAPTVHGESPRTPNATPSNHGYSGLFVSNAPVLP
jgi:hypothetical protein